MSDEIEIINMSNMSLDICDIGVKLPGKGSRHVIALEIANKSIFLRDFKQKKWVQCKPYRRPQVMPHWPFHKVQPPPRISESELVNPQIPSPPKVPSFGSSTPTHPSPTVTNDGTLTEIRDLLRLLVEKPATTPPEVIAAHVATHLARVNGYKAPGAVHVAGTLDDAPQFIPDKIIPDNAELSIKKNNVEVEKADFNDAAEALRNLRKKTNA